MTIQRGRGKEGGRWRAKEDGRGGSRSRREREKEEERGVKGEGRLEEERAGERE